MGVTLYHVISGNKHEIEAISKVKPSHLLCSYFYFKNKSLRSLCEDLGYQPKILLDSGAFSAFSTGRNISPIDYMTYIEQNQSYIEWYISLDVIGDERLSEMYYQIMRTKGFKPVPVYHIGDSLERLDYYCTQSEKVALGGTVFIQDKKRVARWIYMLKKRQPNTQFHLLGSSSTWITSLPGLDSCDSSTWILQAKNGNPRHIRGTSAEAKIQRAIYNLRKSATATVNKIDFTPETIEEPIFHEFESSTPKVESDPLRGLLGSIDEINGIRNNQYDGGVSIKWKSLTE